MLKVTDSLDILKGLIQTRCFPAFGGIPAPRVIAYTVTWRCNAGCDMCGVKNVDKKLKDPGRELTAADIDKIFTDPFLRKPDLIRFTGGEPFLKEDFIGIVENIIKNTKTKIYYITTNGFYGDRISELVERLAPKTRNLVIQISLDAIGDAHDRIRKIPGLYDRVVRALEGLKKLKTKHAFSFGVNQTVTIDTARYIDDIAALCERMGCDHKVYMGQDVHESDILEGDALRPELALVSNPDKKDIELLYEKIRRHYDKKRQNVKRSLSLPEYLWRAVEDTVILGSKNRLLFDRAFPNPRCLAMFFYLRMLPDGTIMPCTLRPRAIGNLKDNSFTEIWKSKKANDARMSVKHCKGCWVECDIVPNIAYSFGTMRKLAGELLMPKKERSV